MRSALRVCTSVLFINFSKECVRLQTYNFTDIELGITPYISVGAVENARFTVVSETITDDAYM